MIRHAVERGVPVVNWGFIADSIAAGKLVPVDTYRYPVEKMIFGAE
jgi:hypothetical protein